jgi:hypothetical protein
MRFDDTNPAKENAEFEEVMKYLNYCTILYNYFTCFMFELLVL